MRKRRPTGRVSCRRVARKRRAPQLVCRATLRAVTARARVTVRLVRGKRTYARRSARVRGKRVRVAVTIPRKLRAGRFTAVVEVKDRGERTTLARRPVRRG